MPWVTYDHHSGRRRGHIVFLLDETGSMRTRVDESWLGFRGGRPGRRDPLFVPTRGQLAVEGLNDYVESLKQDRELGLDKVNFTLVKWNSNRRYARSEEHTSELQSRPHLVCRLLLE